MVQRGGGEERFEFKWIFFHFKATSPFPELKFDSPERNRPKMKSFRFKIVSNCREQKNLELDFKAGILSEFFVPLRSPDDGSFRLFPI